MDPEELEKFIDKYGYWSGECPEAPVEDWIHEARNGDTRLGYWEWAYRQMEVEE